MRKLYGLALLLCLPLLSYGQARNTGVRLKGPLYQDEVLLITRNLVQIRAELPFYLYTVANGTYADKPSTPILLGARYERLLKGKASFGLEFELNDYEAKLKDGGRPFDVPKHQQVFKVTPHLRFYFRSQRARKQLFKGFNLNVGPTLMSIQQSLDESQLSRLGNPNVDSADVYRFGASTIFGLSAALGYQHTFGQVVVAGISAEAIFCGEQFQQEAYFRSNIGNGAMYLNPFKLYIGARF